MICCVGLVALLDLMVLIFVRKQLSDTLGAKHLAHWHTIADNLAARSEHFVLTEDFVSLLELVGKLKASDQDVAYAYVTDRKGRVLAHTFAGGFPKDLVDVNRLKPGEKWSQVSLQTTEQGPVHDISVGILDGKVGSAHIGIAEHGINRTISHLTLALTAIAGFVLVVAVGLAAVVSWAVTQPIRKLIEAAEKIRDGDLGQQVASTTKDEIGDLVESFNQMSDELLKQRKILDDRNRRIRTAQEQSAWERDKLRAIIDSMVEGVIFVGADGKISLCNESATRIWGKGGKQLVGLPLEKCHRVELRQQIEGILRKAKDKPGFAVAHPMEVQAGSCVSSYSSVHSQDGRFLGLVLLSLDMSERAALEEQQKRLRDQLFQQEKMVLIGQIAASVAHELNTPLGTVLLRTQMMQQQMHDGGDLSDLKVIESETRRCRNIIDSLLGFSRRSEGVWTRTNVDSLITDSLSLIKNDLAIKGLTVETENGHKDAIILADGNQIQQVLLNLVTNAADAMSRGGRLRITTRLLHEQDNDMVEIQVIDNGCGMDQDVLGRAFEPFFTTKGRGKGTGLGLAICRRIVEEHRGEIHISSRPGRGTTVSVRLPHTPAEAQSSE
jgi:PAS domain S-box-containing protein